MPCNLSHLFDDKTSLKEPACSLSAQVVIAQILNAQFIPLFSKHDTYPFLFEGENQVTGFWLLLHDIPGLSKQRNIHMIANFFSRMLSIPDQYGFLLFVYVIPTEACHLSNAHAGEN